MTQETKSDPQVVQTLLTCTAALAVKLNDQGNKPVAIAHAHRADSHPYQSWYPGGPGIAFSRLLDHT